MFAGGAVDRRFRSISERHPFSKSKSKVAIVIQKWSHVFAGKMKYFLLMKDPTLDFTNMDVKAGKRLFYTVLGGLSMQQVNQTVHPPANLPSVLNATRPELTNGYRNMTI